MLIRPRIFVTIIAAVLLSIGVGAQDTNGALTPAQPASMQMVSGDIFRFDYTLEQASRVVLQAISGTAQPTLSVQQRGVEVAAQPNTEGAFTIELDTVLGSGSYIVEVAGANNSSGLVILSVQSQTPLPVTPLTPGVAVAGTLTRDASVAMFEFTQMPESGYLVVDTLLPDRGVAVQIVDMATLIPAAGSSTAILGARFQFAPGDAVYQMQVGSAGIESDTPFNVCWVPVSAANCTNVASPPVVITIVTSEPAPAACTVTPASSGGVNIRQSATTNSIIAGALPTGQNANVMGISPDNAWFNIEFNAISGWVASAVVTVNGDCSSLPTVQPPAPILPPTPTPLPTNTPVPVPPTPSGPCLFTLTAPTFVYTTTVEQVDFLYDQVQSGELIPNGRTADGNWYRLNYASSWLPAHAIGQTVSRSGNCANLPTVSP